MQVANLGDREVANLVYNNELPKTQAPTLII